MRCGDLGCGAGAWVRWWSVVGVLVGRGEGGGGGHAVGLVETGEGGGFTGVAGAVVVAGGGGGRVAGFEAGLDAFGVAVVEDGVDGGGQVGAVPGGDDEE